MKKNVMIQRLREYPILEQENLVLKQENLALKQENGVLKQENGVLKRDNAVLIKEKTVLARAIQKLQHPHVGSPPHVSVGEITPLNPRRSDQHQKRLNLLIPSINKEDFFGGISTALRFFDKLSGFGSIKRRMITLDADPDPGSITKFNAYTLVQSDMDHPLDMELIGMKERWDKTIPVGKNDYFISTAWWTALLAQKIIKWQKKEYCQPARKLVYLIQDYEPGFYPWSGRYALADSTYSSDSPQIAVFNSSLLYEFFKKNEYAFENEYVFEPTLNQTLQAGLNQRRTEGKKKQILIYGRPGVARNAFPIIVEALRQWVSIQPDASDWSLISAGEKHQDIVLGNDMILSSVGKLSLQDYITVLNESAIGISLMVSPHPSYPPLEMAMYGLGVISNIYANKNLSLWHENISSIQLTVDNLITSLMEHCDRFNKNNQFFVYGKLLKTEYLESDHQFSFMEDLEKQLFVLPSPKKE